MPRSSQPRLVTLALLAVMVFFAPLRAGATLADALTLEELVERSDRIALVRVIQQSTQYDTRGRIITLATVRVEDGLLAAQTGDEFDVVSLGGIIGEIGMRIAGEPSFVDGERVVVFVRHINGAYRPVGMSQGVFPVNDAETPTVEPGGSGLSLVRPNTSGELTPAGAALRGRRNLAHVLDRVRELIRRR